MQTCPHCHNVLVSPMCCTYAHANAHQVPMVFSLNPGHLHPLSTIQPQTPHTASSPFINGCGGNGGEEASEAEKMEGREPSLSSLPTPHVSGHMFHFPNMNNGLAQRLSACQLTCHINCLTHGTLLCPPAICTDSSLHNAHRRHSSGWGVTSPIDRQIPTTGAEETRRLETSKRALKQSGWYWARLSWQEAEVLLQPTAIGTFLMRDSADPHHSFSLSVQTEKGPTSVRIHFSNGKFRLKCEASIKASLPEFSGVIKLIEYYVKSNEKYNNHVWVDAAGKVYSPIRITRPLLKSVPSLKHLSRRATNYSYSRHVTAERLPPSLLKYIDEYPYWC